MNFIGLHTIKFAVKKQVKISVLPKRTWQKASKMWGKNTFR